MSSTSERRNSKMINDNLFPKKIINEHKSIIRIRNQNCIITDLIFDMLQKSKFNFYELKKNDGIFSLFFVLVE